MSAKLVQIESPCATCYYSSILTIFPTYDSFLVEKISVFIPVAVEAVEGRFRDL